MQYIRTYVTHENMIMSELMFLVSDCRFGLSPVNYPDPDVTYEHV